MEKSKHVYQMHVGIEFQKKNKLLPHNFHHLDSISSTEHLETLFSTIVFCNLNEKILCKIKSQIVPIFKHDSDRRFLVNFLFFVVLCDCSSIILDV